MAHPKHLNMPFSETKHPQPPAPTLCLCSVCTRGFFGRPGKNICSECRWKIAHGQPLPDSLSMVELRHVKEVLAQDVAAENQAIAAVEKIQARTAQLRGAVA